MIGPGLLDLKSLARFDTPDEIAEFLAERAVGRTPTSVCDPTCGGGALLVAARRRGAMVYGVDRDPGAAAEAASRLGERVGGRIKVGDALVDPLEPELWPEFVRQHRLILEDAAERRIQALLRDDPEGLAEADALLADLKIQVASRLPAELAHRAFCWVLEFPEIALEGGFGAAMTNPPWDKLKVLARETVASPRELSVFRQQTATLARWLAGRWGSGAGDRNSYQGVLSLALALIPPGGGLGAILPGGFWTDLGARPFREALLDGFAEVSTWGFEARTEAFPAIDQRVAILVATPRIASGDPSATRINIASNLAGLADLATSRPVGVPQVILRRTAPISLAYPALRSECDLEILERLYEAGPPFGEGPWQPQFARDLDMTADAAAFDGVVEGDPLWEGKRIGAFELCPVDPIESGSWPNCQDGCSRWRHCPVTRKGSRQLRVDRARAPDRGHWRHSRVAWRTVARGDRARRLEATLIPAGYRLGNSLNYLEGDRQSDADKLTLLAYLNSLVLEWRFRQLANGNNVNLFAIRQLPVPPGVRPDLADLAGALMFGSGGWPGSTVGWFPPPALTDRRQLRLELEARVARAFGLGAEDLGQIFAAFPKLPEVDRSAILEALDRNSASAR